MKDENDDADKELRDIKDQIGDIANDAEKAVNNELQGKLNDLKEK